MTPIVSIDNLPQALDPINTSTSLMRVIATAALDKEFDLERMERLFNMHLKMEAREDEKQFDVAMAAAQAAMRNIVADSNNTATRSMYASYYALDKAIRPIYTQHGFSLGFRTEPGLTPDVLNVICRVSHGGFARECHIPMPADGKGAKGGDVMTKTHAIGSAVTYGMRYLLKMVFNLAIGGQEDDDGNGASGRASAIEPELPASVRAFIDHAKTTIAEFTDAQKLTEWWSSEAQKSMRLSLDLVNTQAGPRPGFKELWDAFASKGRDISSHERKSAQ